MFLFSFLFDIVEVGGALFLGSYLWQDYRRGWIGVQSFAERGYNLVENLSFGMFSQNSLKSAQKSFKNRAKRFALLQENVAEVETVIQECEERAQENIQLMQKAEEIELDAAKQGDSIILETAASEKLKHQNIADLYLRTAEEYKETLPGLHQVLARAELEFNRAQAQVDTVGVENAITAVNQGLHQILSDVSATSGYTDKGEMDRLQVEAHHERIKSGKLLQITKVQKNQQIQEVLEDKALKAEIESVYARVAALPSPEPEESHANGIAVVEGNGSAVITPELVEDTLAASEELPHRVVH